MKYLFLILYFCFFNFHKEPKDTLVENFDIKWKLTTLPDNKFKITIDAKKESEYIEFSDIRFVVDYYKGDGTLITTETVNFFPKPETKEEYFLKESLSGGNEVSKVFQYYHSGVSIVKGKKLQFHWFNRGVRFEPPDRNNPKPIPVDVVYGEGSVDVSQ